MNFLNLGLLKKKKTNMEKNIEDNAIYSNEVVDNVIDEKDLLFQKLTDMCIFTLEYSYGLKKDNISLDFLKRLVDDANFLELITLSFVNRDIVEKINNNTLRVRDVKEYNKKLFQYDIFSKEDEELLEILRSKITLSDKRYVGFSIEEYQNYAANSNYVNITIPSFFEQNEILIEKKKAIPISNNYFYVTDNSQVVKAIDQNEIFNLNIFDEYGLMSSF